MNVTKLGAIDIGSNSVRCLISNVVYKDGYTYYRKVSMIRLPIRLGQEVFLNGALSEETAARFAEGMQAYKHLLKVHGVQDFRAVATSAMREAANGAELVKKVRKSTGIDIQIIDGAEEARLVFNSKLYDIIQAPQEYFIYIDVGGGSTELSILHDQDVIASESFKIGGVRVMNGLDTEEEWLRMKKWTERHMRNFHNKAAIGAGGNINKLHKISLRSLNKPLRLSYIEDQFDMISALDVEERVTQLGLNFDRADIIVHALPIYMKVMQWAGVGKIYVPKIGVSDGLIRDLYHKEYKEKVEGQQA
ncbi:MAG: exopolyphosphatase [Schleiferiaceae bacterium]|jgi:exopolyphosphatase/guanosine-5'-triphosphate,3'-diphosphate pyrophosphatase